MSPERQRSPDQTTEFEARIAQLEQGLPMSETLNLVTNLVEDSQSPEMLSRWERIKEELIGSRSYEAFFHEGLTDSTNLAAEILDGHEFSWWDVDAYAEEMAETFEVVSKGQFVAVLGKYAINAEAGWGPVLYANHADLIPGPNYFLNALANATVSNFGDGFPPHMLADEAASKLSGGSKCCPYHPGPFMDTVAKELIDLTPIGTKEGAMVAYFNSGGDAISVALRAAEKFARQNGRNGRKVAVAFKEAYHGNIEGRAGAITGGINEVCDDQEKRALILEYPNQPEEIEPVLEQLTAAIERNEVAAIVFEARQGDGGGVGMHPDFFVEMVKLSLDREIPLVCDEVQSGFGRTGRLWAVDFLLDHWQKTTYVQQNGYPENPPIIVAVAKSLTNGAIPGSAVVFPEKYAVLERAQGLNTYSGHPGTLAAAYITCQLMKDPTLPLMVARNRATFDSNLAPFIGEDRLIREVRGEGLFLFLALDENFPMPDYPSIGYNQLMQAELIGTQRVLTGTVARNALRVHLPLNAPETVHKATARAIGRVAESIEQGQWDSTSAYVLQTGGPSGLAER